MLLTLKECLERHGSYYAIRKKIAAGELFKVESGLYSDCDEYVPGERLIQKKFPNAVFTMESALAKRLERVLLSATYLRKLAGSKVNWLQVDPKEVSTRILDFLKEM